MIAFTKVALPFGWLGNMSAHKITYGGRTWRTAEALFQALRFEDETIINAIHAATSPMTAKMIAKKNKKSMIIEKIGAEDLDNMRMVLRLKIEQHPHLRNELLATKDAAIIEDTSKRASHSPWGAKYKDQIWVGDNLLGRLWMEVRDELRGDSSLRRGLPQ